MAIPGLTVCCCKWVLVLSSVPRPHASFPVPTLRCPLYTQLGHHTFWGDFHPPPMEGFLLPGKHSSHALNTAPNASGTVLDCLEILTHLNLPTTETSALIPISERERGKHRKVDSLAQGQTASEWMSRDSNPGGSRGRVLQNWLVSHFSSL